MDFSKENESQQGRWASSPSIDGNGQFEYIENPEAMGKVPLLQPAPPIVHGTKPGPLPPTP